MGNSLTRIDFDGLKEGQFIMFKTHNIVDYNFTIAKVISKDEEKVVIYSFAENRNKRIDPIEECFELSLPWEKEIIKKTNHWPELKPGIDVLEMFLIENPEIFKKMVKDSISETEAAIKKLSDDKDLFETGMKKIGLP
jgi:hypothetical protein